MAQILTISNEQDSRIQREMGDKISKILIRAIFGKKTPTLLTVVFRANKRARLVIRALNLENSKALWTLFLTNKC